jgi:hypothetical protein
MELLGVVVCNEHANLGDRYDVCEPSETLQAAVVRGNAGKKYRAHRHLPVVRQTATPTAEAWVVMRGKVLLTVYDLDDTPFEPVELQAGECWIGFRGGHGYEILEDDTVVWEFKTGPYFGQESDKIFIAEDG